MKKDLATPIKHDPPRLQCFIGGWMYLWLVSLYIDRGKSRGKRLYIWLPANSDIDPHVLVEYPPGTW